MKSKKLLIFVTVKKNLESLALDANKLPFHRRQLLFIVLCLLAIVLQCLYLVNDEITTREYMSCISITTIAVLVYIAFWSAIFETATIYEFMDCYETIINERELISVIVHFKNAYSTSKILYFCRT